MNLQVDVSLEESMETEIETSPPGDQPSLEVAKEADSIDDVDDDDVEDLGDGDKCETEDSIRGKQKLNSVSTIASLRMKPASASRFSIPLCRLLAMPMVRPTLESDLDKLEQEFVHGYRDGAAVFYVSATNEDGCIQEVTDEVKASWGPLWNEENDKFNRYLASVPELTGLVNLMFFVCDGNHRRQAWMNHINRLHKSEASWHYSVDSIVLDTKNRISLVMQVMHDINKYVSHTSCSRFSYLQTGSWFVWICFSFFFALQFLICN